MEPNFKTKQNTAQNKLVSKTDWSLVSKVLTVVNGSLGDVSGAGKDGRQEETGTTLGKTIR